MLAITGALQNNPEVMKLISAYQSNNEKMGLVNGTEKIDVITDGMDSAFNSKETTPEAQKADESANTQLDQSNSGYSCLNNSLVLMKAFIGDQDRYGESTVSQEIAQPIAIRPQYVAIGENEKQLDFCAQESMPKLQPQSARSSQSASPPLSETSDRLSTTPSKNLGFRKRSAAKYFGSLQNGVDPSGEQHMVTIAKIKTEDGEVSRLQNDVTPTEEKWYRCITAPMGLYTDIISALGISTAQNVVDGYAVYECKGKEKYSCPYRARIKSKEPILICEHNGCHWHEADTDIPESSGSGTSRTYKGWFTCFDGPTTLKTPFLASLCVATKNNFQDGYELYDCLYQKKFKCDYKVRVKQIGNYFICEELGCHRHGVEKEVGSTTGLPSAFKDVVDIAFYQNWSYSVRQQKLSEAAASFNLVWDRKLTRQIDNRLSYLRRTTNIRRAVELGKQKESLGESTIKEEP